MNPTHFPASSEPPKGSTQRTVGLVFGGRSVEHEVSIRSARTIASALETAGFRVVPLGIATDGSWLAPEVSARALDAGPDAVTRLVPADPGASAAVRRATFGFALAALTGVGDSPAVDVVFPIVHGTGGEDGALQGLCETLDLPYVGCGVTASAVCMDKALTKQVLAAAGLTVVDSERVDRRQWQNDPDAVLDRCARLHVPVFVKPSSGGSSVGVVRVGSFTEIGDAIEHALRFDDHVLVEEGIEGRELECAVLGHDTVEASGIGEIVPGKPFYDYADKYLDDTARLEHRADLPAETEAALRAAAVRAFRAVDGSGLARVDFLYDGETAYLNEINTLPGFTAISMYPKLWQVQGVDPPALVERLVDAAFERHRGRRHLDQGIRGWIDSLDDD